VGTTEPVEIKDAEAALGAFVDARQAAQVALEQCEALAASNDDLRTSARHSAESVQRCEKLLEAISRIGPELQEVVRGLDEGVAGAAIALREVATSTQDLEDRLTKSLQARVAEQLGGTTAGLQSEARAAVDEAVAQLQGELAEHTAELRSAQQSLRSALERAVATVEKRIKPPTPVRVHVGGWGFIVAFLAALLTGAGLWALMARDSPFTFEVLEDRLLAAGVAAGLGVLGVTACVLLLVSLLRREDRWWLSVIGLMLAVAATAAAVVAGVQIMVG
jgi:hypothetical protein